MDEIYISQGYALSERSMASDRMPGSMMVPWVLYAAYLAAPMYDVPLLPLSWSAVFAIPVTVLALSMRVPPSRAERTFHILISIIWAALVFSAIVNVAGERVAEMSVRFSYWLLMSIVALRVLRYVNGPEVTWRACFCGISLLGAVAFFEKCYFSDFGAAYSQLTLMTQNSYGSRFSTFVYFLIGGTVFWQRGWRMVAIVTLAIVLGAVLLLGSRGAWVGIAAGLIVLLVLAYLGGLRTRAAAIAIAIVVLGLGFLMGKWALGRTPYVSERIQTLERLESSKSFQLRLTMTRKAVGLWKDYPWFGVGIGQFTRTTAEFRVPDLLSYYTEEGLNRRSSHNSWAQWLAETGVIGTLPLLLLWVWLMVKGSAAALQLARRGRYFGLVFVAGFVGMSVHFVAISGLTDTVPWFVFALVAAVVVHAEQEIIHSHRHSLRLAEES